jgi:hypothetical protein
MSKTVKITGYSQMLFILSTLKIIRHLWLQLIVISVQRLLKLCSSVKTMSKKVFIMQQMGFRDFKTRAVVFAAFKTTQIFLKNPKPKSETIVGVIATKLLQTLKTSKLECFVLGNHLRPIIFYQSLPEWSVFRMIKWLSCGLTHKNYKGGTNTLAYLCLPSVTKEERVLEH